MDSKELRGLMEAYAEMYAPQEVDEATAMAKRGYDEAPIRQKIAKSTGGGSAADRATALADKQVFRGDGSARDKLARTQRGDFRKTTSSSPGLRVGQFKSNDPEVQAKQAARGAQRSVLTPAEKARLNREEFDIFDVVLEFLQVEGFAETLEEAEWLMSNVIDEEAIDIILGEEELDEASRADEFTRAAIARNSGKKGGITFEPGPNWDPSANRGKGAHLSPKQKEKQRRKGLRQEAFEAWLDEAMTNYEKNRKRAAQRAAARNEARAQGKTGAVPGVGYVTPRKERETWTDESGKTRHAKGL